MIYAYKTFRELCVSVYSAITTTVTYVRLPLQFVHGLRYYYVTLLPNVTAFTYNVSDSTPVYSEKDFLYFQFNFFFFSI